MSSLMSKFKKMDKKKNLSKIVSELVDKRVPDLERKLTRLAYHTGNDLKVVNDLIREFGNISLASAAMIELCVEKGVFTNEELTESKEKIKIITAETLENRKKELEQAKKKKGEENDSPDDGCEETSEDKESGEETVSEGIEEKGVA